MNQNNENLNQNQEQQTVQNVYSTPVQNIGQNTINAQNSNNKGKVIFIIIAIVIVILGVCVSTFFIINNKPKEEQTENEEEIINNKKYLTEYKMSSNSLEEFDLYFLKEENEKTNKIYSPLSIKYALKMLEEGAGGNTKTQLSTVLGDYVAKKYNNNANMSFANALFIRQSFSNSINEQYKQLLLNNYNAEVILDSFETPNNINNWISNKTFKLINNLVDDVSSNDFILINALAIDMEWQEKFLRSGEFGGYAHEQSDKEDVWLGVPFVGELWRRNFANVTNEISGMGIEASINNYDVIKEIGEENIRKTVGDAYREYIKNDLNAFREYKNLDENFEITDEYIEEEIKNYLDHYIEEIGKNYHKNYRVTDFSLYTDENVKVFAKDLKEYDGTTLQYVGIMPVNEDLDEYVKNVKSSELNNIISNLKGLKNEDFEEGIIVKIEGYIPKFKFEYELDLTGDLKKLGVTDVFDNEKADLSNLTAKKGSYIADTKHKANIEFTQDGIKAAAVTLAGGLGAGGYFDYHYEVPTKFIDLTFDKPYMFLIRDKKTGEIWFTGTVYEPLLWEEDATTGY